MAYINKQQTLPTDSSGNYEVFQFQNSALPGHISPVQYYTPPPAAPVEALPSSSPVSDRYRISRKKKYFFCSFLILVLLVIMSSLIVIIVRIEEGNEKKEELADKVSGYKQPRASCYGVYTSDTWINQIGILKQIHLPGSDEETKLNVYCDGSDGGEWIVIQYRPQRNYLTTSFAELWSSYEEGFGDKNGYWLGLKNLHDLTSAADYELRIDMEDYCGSYAYATYSYFKIGGSDEKYKLTVYGFEGNSTDSLSSSSGNVFSISSRYGTCPASGGWWFSDNYYNCHDANLNGKSYYSSLLTYQWYCYGSRCDCVSSQYAYGTTNYRLGSFWEGFGGGSKLIKVTKIRMKPKFY